MPGTSVEEEVAALLVATGAVSFRTEPFFTFTSGTRSPVYVDNRRLLGHVAERRAIVRALVNLLRDDAGEVAFGAVAGTATAGIPWAAWIAADLDLPMLYVRSSAKEWGKQRTVEGTAPTDAPVAIVEDLAFTAGSLATSTRELRQAGFEVPLALTIVSYETPAGAARIADVGVDHRTLTTIDAALASAAQSGALDAEQVTIVEDWLQDVRSETAR